MWRKKECACVYRVAPQFELILAHHFLFWIHTDQTCVIWFIKCFMQEDKMAASFIQESGPSLFKETLYIDDTVLWVDST